jgi:orotate phosphoribosyltransferase
MKPEDYALALLQINAIKLQPGNPFTWASGIKSPIYCDNRLSLSYPKVRESIALGLANLIKNEYPDTTAIVAVATGGIAHGTLVAHFMGLPLAYVRSAPKGHGLGNMIEGHIRREEKICIIEDLVSTGKSSLNAYNALIDEGYTISGMAAIFTYGFPSAAEAFKKARCRLNTLTNYNALLNKALEMKTISNSELEVLERWNKAPMDWIPESKL